MKITHFFHINRIAIVCALMFTVNILNAQFSGTLGGGLSSGLSSLGSNPVRPSTANSIYTNPSGTDPNNNNSLSANPDSTFNRFSNRQSSPFGGPTTGNNPTINFTDPGGPGGGGTGGDVNDTGVPLDGGLSVLLAFGVGAGYKKSRQKKRQTTTV